MTFQHNKLEDSPVFRSLAKVAQSKGWIKEETVIKTAAPKLDLNPSNDLTQNLLKLCQGLRASGFDKQAEELESKFVFYKKAQSMYGVSNEEGEDLVHDAHPKGSHKLENVDSQEATVEDILDQHIKDLEVVNKTPHGKLSTSQDILNAVKIVLAQNQVTNTPSVLTEESLDDLYTKAMASLKGFIKIYFAINYKLGNQDLTENKYFNTIETLLRTKNIYGQRDIENALINSLNDLKNDEEPGFLASESEKLIWQDEIMPMLIELNKYAGWFYDSVAKIHNKESAAKTEAVKKQYAPPETGVAKTDSQSEEIIQGDTLINTLMAYKSVNRVVKNPVAMTWIDSQIKEIKDVIDRYQRAAQTGQIETVKESLDEEMKTKTLEIKDFYNKAVKPIPATQ